MDGSDYTDMEHFSSFLKKEKNEAIVMTTSPPPLSSELWSLA